MDGTPTATFSKSTLTFNLHPTRSNSEEKLLLTNISKADLAFKVKTNNVSRYYVRPNAGAVSPGATITIHITLQPHPPCPSPGSSTDRFLIQTAVVPGLAATRSPEDYWQMRDAFKRMSVTRLDVHFGRDEDVVRFESPPPPTPLQRSNSMPNTVSNRPPPSIKKRASMPGLRRGLSDEPGTFRYMSAPPGPLKLDRYTLQIRVTRPPHLSYSCMLSLPNGSSRDICFRIKCTNSSRYIIRPSRGVIKGRTAVLVSVSLQPCEMVPEPGLSEDKVLVLTCNAPRSGRVSEEFWREREKGRHLVGYELAVDFVEEIEKGLGLRRAFLRSRGIMGRLRRSRLMSSDVQKAIGRPWQDATGEVVVEEEEDDAVAVVEQVRLLKKVLEAKNLQVGLMEDELRKLKVELRLNGLQG